MNAVTPRHPATPGTRRVLPAYSGVSIRTRCRLGKLPAWRETDPPDLPERYCLEGHSTAYRTGRQTHFCHFPRHRFSVAGLPPRIFPAVKLDLVFPMLLDGRT